MGQRGLVAICNPFSGVKFYLVTAFSSIRIAFRGSRLPSELPMPRPLQLYEAYLVGGCQYRRYEFATPGRQRLRRDYGGEPPPEAFVLTLCPWRLIDAAGHH
jgi:hypothetical protein